MKRTITILTIVAVLMIAGTASAGNQFWEALNSGSHGSRSYGGRQSNFFGGNRGGSYGGYRNNSGLEIIDMDRGIIIRTGGPFDTWAAGDKIDQALAEKEKPKQSTAEMEKTVHRIQARPKHNTAAPTIEKENAELSKENLELQREILSLQIQILKLRQELLRLQKQLPKQ